jgi:TIGR02757 family protein
MTTEEILLHYAELYCAPAYFEEDPIIFPKHFADLYKKEKATLQDVEISGLLAAHLAWGRRSMIVRDCRRMFDEMEWQPLRYIENGRFRSDHVSLHRTVMWSDFAGICRAMKTFYCEEGNPSVEKLSPDDIRVRIFCQKSDPKAACKKIHMFRRWMVRDDGIDLGIWHETSPSDLVIPLDVHVHDTARALGLTKRCSADFSTAREITDRLAEIFPGDPLKGDFALFGYGVTHKDAKGIVDKI